MSMIDAMPAMIAAVSDRGQQASKELGQLAGEQQHANDVLRKIGRVDDLLRKIRADGVVDPKELAALRKEVASLAELGVDIDIEEQLAELASGADKEETKTQLESIKDALSDAKDQVRGDISSRDLDLQMLTQEVARAMTLQSNLSKRWSDVADAIVGNMRA
jgi:hypothetical protein